MPTLTTTTRDRDDGVDLVGRSLLVAVRKLAVAKKVERKAVIGAADGRK